MSFGSQDWRETEFVPLLKDPLNHLQIGCVPASVSRDPYFLRYSWQE